MTKNVSELQHKEVLDRKAGGAFKDMVLAFKVGIVLSVVATVMLFVTYFGR